MKKSRTKIPVVRGPQPLYYFPPTLRKYQDHAVGVLDECHKVNKEMAIRVVERRHTHWKNKSTIQMAEEAGNIVSRIPLQQLLFLKI